LNLEILAPAGGPESLTAAVRSGADAVYLGAAGLLNARRSAQGFDQEQLAQAIAYCHGRGVKVYLTLNTLIRQEEEALLLGALETACALGVDAVLVQDLAVAASIQAGCPQLPLHASTQMSITGVAGAKQLEEMGFDRVVLARELTLEEIAAIRRETSLELEVFVHGALCMSVSGQCYLSSVIGGRSGNRGLCAQPCRLPFAGGRSSHALSLKDLSLLDRLEELEQAGVCCVKIEGRMKRPEYVAAAVSACVAARNKAYYNKEDLAAVFSRSGFTEGYLTGQRDASMYGIRQKEDVTAATSSLLKGYQALYRQEVQRVPITFEFTMKAGQPSSLTVRDRQGREVTVTGEEPQKALTAPTDEGRAKAALTKTGGTPFVVEEIQCRLDPDWMLPASALNALRRQALEELLTLRETLHPVAWNRKAAQKVWEPSAVPQPPKEPEQRIRLGRADQLPVAAATNAQLLILPLHLWEEADAALIGENLHRMAVELPRCTFGADGLLPAQLENIRRTGVCHGVVGSLGALRQAKEWGFTLHGDGFLNIFNTPALEEYRRLGLADATLSFELTLAEAKAVQGNLPKGLLAYGYLPLMALRNCPAKAHGLSCKGRGCGYPSLTDRMDKEFFLDCDGRISTLYNCVPLWMGDRLSELRGLDFYTIYLTRETPAETHQVLKGFDKEEKPPMSHTRGLYYRGEVLPPKRSKP
jgi:putative protease